MLQPVEFNQAVNYVNKIRVSSLPECLMSPFVVFVISTVLCSNVVCALVYIFDLFLESISESARYLQVVFRNPSYLPEGAEDYQRGMYIRVLCVYSLNTIWREKFSEENIDRFNQFGLHDLPSSPKFSSTKLSCYIVTVVTFVCIITYFIRVVTLVLKLLLRQRCMHKYPSCFRIKRTCCQSLANFYLIVPHSLEG